MATKQVTLRCDASPLILFTELVKSALQRRKAPLKGIQRPFRLRNLGYELARAESDTTRAGEITVRLYPSDAFLRFAAALLAVDFNLGTIEKTSHDGALPKEKL